MNITVLASIFFATFSLFQIKNKTISVYVVNCVQTKKKIRVSAFNPKDGAKFTAYSDGFVNYGSMKRFKCKGQGKGFCRLNVGIPNGTASSGWGKIKKIRYAKITIRGGKNNKVRVTESSSKPSCN